MKRTLADVRPVLRTARQFMENQQGAAHDGCKALLEQTERMLCSELHVHGGRQNLYRLQDRQELGPLSIDMVDRLAAWLRIDWFARPIAAACVDEYRSHGNGD